MTRGKFNKRGRGRGSSSRAPQGRGSSHSTPKKSNTPTKRNQIQQETNNNIPSSIDNDMNDDKSLLYATIACCSKQLPISNQSIETKISDSEISKIESVIKQMSIEEQTSYEFVVPIESLQSEIHNSLACNDENTKDDNKEEIVKIEKEETKKTEKEKLEEWLDDLLG